MKFNDEIRKENLAHCSEISRDRMGLAGRRRQGGAKRRYLDENREDIEVMGAVEDTEDRNKWQTLTRCGDP